MRLIRSSTLRDKLEFEEEIASDSEPKFEPRQGRYKVARGGAPKGREPRERVKKRNSSPSCLSVSEGDEGGI